MPRLDKQGPPNGEGNQSGRRMGKCNPNNKNHSESPENTRGNRRNKSSQPTTIKGGRGLGRRHRAFQQNSEDSKE